MAKKAKKKAEQELKDWTVMVYLAGDNNLSTEMVWSIKEMYRAGLNEKIGLVVQFDPSAKSMQRFDVGNDLQKLAPKEQYPAPEKVNNSDSWAAQKTALQLRVTSDAEDGLLPRRGHEVPQIREMVSEKKNPPRTLVQFIKDSRTAHPANNYMLILSGHGSGAVGRTFLVDGSPPKAFNMPELSQALKDAGGDIAVLGMDSCGMGMAEVGYELRQSVRFLVAAEGFELSTGWPYHKLLDALTKDQTFANDPRGLAAKVVQDYTQYYSDYTLAGVSTDLAACDLRRSGRLVRAVRELALLLNDRLFTSGKGEGDDYYVEDLSDPSKPAVADAVILAHWRAQSYRFEEYLDLWDFCDLLEKGCGDQKIIEACQSIKGIVEGPRLDDGTNDGYVIKSCHSGGVFQHSHGVSVYFPWTEVLPEYNALRFSTDSGRRIFLTSYVKRTRRRPRKGSGRPQVVPPADNSLLVVRDNPLQGTKDNPLQGTKEEARIVPKVKNPPTVFYETKC